MMDAASDNSIRNGGVAMGMGGAESIDSNLISRLLLVYDTLFLFWCTLLVNLSVISMCSFTLSLDRVDHGVSVCFFTGLDLACDVIVCSFTLPDLLEWGVNECSLSKFVGPGGSWCS